MRQRLSESAGTNYIANSGNNGYSKSSQWMTLWAADAFELAADRQKIKEQWAKMEPLPGNRFVWPGIPWVAPGVNVLGAVDELVFVHEAHVRGMIIRNRTMTYVNWHGIVVDDIRVDAEEPAGSGHPGAWNADNDTAIRPFLNAARDNGDFFFRKVHKGALSFFMRHLEAEITRFQSSSTNTPREQILPSRRLF